MVTYGLVELPEGVLPMVGKEQTHASGLRGMVVPCKFDQVEPCFLMMLKVVHIRPKVLFQNGVAALCLAVCLWVQGGG